MELEKNTNGRLMITVKENTMTMSINDFARRWGLGSNSLRAIIKTHPDFPCIKIGRTRSVIIDDADLWIKRNLRG